jgi:hypothetical protein
MCDHGRSTELFLESINNHNFWSTRCNSFDEILKNSCTAAGENQRLGGEPSNQNRNVGGVFYLATNSASLFAKG